MGDLQKMSDWPAWKLPVLEPGPRVGEWAGEKCNYLEGRVTRFRAFQAGKMSGEAYQACMDAGFRRSGMVVYQPMCDGCRKCIPLRVPTGAFAASKSQRRVLRGNGEVVVKVRKPEVTVEKWLMYQRYQREWHGGEMTSDLGAFAGFLYESPVETVEMEYRDGGGRLMGVGICDLLPRSLSSVYFYFEPAEAGRSLGTFSALYEILWAKEMGIAYWYAGYWVPGCGAMEYKARFRPCEVLGTDGEWRGLGNSEFGVQNSE